MERGDIIEFDSNLDEKEKALLTSAGFYETEEQGRGGTKWNVPADCIIICQTETFDRFTNLVFFGDTVLVTCRQKTAIYDRWCMTNIDESSITKYINGELDSIQDENFKEANDIALKMSRQENERQVNLSKTDRNAYQQEGLMAMASLVQNGDECIVC